MRVVLAAALTVLLAQTDGPKLEAVAGPWETERGDGLFIVANVTTNSENIQVRVSHGRSGNQTWGWYVTPLERGGVQFDGQRLWIPTVGLDVSFEGSSWKGFWRLDGQLQPVVLQRPRPASDDEVSPLCGEWAATPDPRLGVSGSLAVAQFADGSLVGWMHRDMGEWHRYGERLTVARVLLPQVVLNLETAVAPPYRYEGTVSQDGRSLTGIWRAGDVDPSKMTLNAPRIFHRVQGCK